MSDSLLVSLLLFISLLTLASTLMMELKPLRAFLYRVPDDWRLQMMLAALFGLLATLSTYCGFNGANITTPVSSVSQLPGCWAGRWPASAPGSSAVSTAIFMRPAALPLWPAVWGR